MSTSIKTLSTKKNVRRNGSKRDQEWNWLDIANHFLLYKYPKHSHVTIDTGIGQCTLNLCPSYFHMSNTALIRLIPQGTVDFNQGKDRLAGPKALDPFYYRQQTLWLYDLCLEVLTEHGTELRLFGAKALPPTYTINIAHMTKKQ